MTRKPKAPVSKIPPRITHRQVTNLFVKAGVPPPKTEDQVSNDWLIGPESYTYIVDEDGTAVLSHISGQWFVDREDVVELVEREIEVRRKAFDAATLNTAHPAPRILISRRVGPYLVEQAEGAGWFAYRDAWGGHWRSGMRLSDGLPTREAAIECVRAKIKAWAVGIIERLDGETRPETETQATKASKT